MLHTLVKNLLRIVSIAALLTVPTKVIFACSCGPTPTVLDAFEESDVVIIVRVISVEKVEAKSGDEDEDYVDNVRSSTVMVEKVYKGNVRVRDELVFRQGGGADCIWTFNEELIGRRILFYLNRPEPPDKLWYAVTCGRSSGVDGATEDFLYLNNIKKVRGKTRVSGTYGYWNGSDFDAANKKIRIFNEKKSFETKTNHEGIYEIYDLPAGTYRLEPEMPKGWRIAQHWLRNSQNATQEQDSTRSVVFTLEPKKHANLDVSFEPDNAVEGSVVDPNGAAMVNVCAYLWEPDESDVYGSFDCTDEQGRFRIESITAGSYHLVLNRTGKPNSKKPFSRTFYPGVAEREKAALITIGYGETVKGIDVVIPKVVETISVEGVLLYSDDKPFVDEDVSFKANESYGDDGNEREKTDVQGRFKLKIVKGVKGVILSDVFVSLDSYENCPKLDALIRESGNNFTSIKSSQVTIEGDRDIFDLIIKFPFPACKRKKE